jgi:hypothetical protein
MEPQASLVLALMSAFAIAVAVLGTVHSLRRHRGLESRLSKAARNEARKLSCNLFNGLAIASIAVGAVSPYLAIPKWTMWSLFAASLAIGCGTAFHAIARTIARRLED